ncbi:ATP-binding cassette domain-containing protein [Corynebacterium aurimucosum]|uniref:Putative ABC transport system, ATP-binding protein n=1 Tax=Corynebacterium aurimucosum (strain ATCC 700975 / DSM 44827 / CIP 107346 / CN-1) TaxID=548476 RepID=C3PKN6_CORA7|nr:ABC transporter ATP-binding protein [Corynebacterium aurimucosum]ACP31972.1 putative ABC transport system, ATP-binding protein [Corynebacterium aurimucosum ATCC 700975]QQU93820.1 ABC transporter ATP-binding protein [Corynebacterium aurimucosum]QQU95749.1 ABC transporter ATP-binding protein [Corynebacterium aurimucosum]UTA71375.1 ABC transporter ATP-binding protein [Corynebacterium aurimucosum]WJY69538.1 Putative HMP/thiamine import ATP-binding protein YkoD [Corynebacterium aurimucosum]
MADVGSAGATKLVARGYGWTHAGRRAPALADIDLVVSPGEKVLLCGDSGSGKSTLLAAIAGVLGGDDEGTRVGEILLEDASGHVEPPGRTIPVGLVLQDPDSQVIAARVGDDVAFGCENLAYPRSEIWQRVSAALSMVGPSVDLSFPTEQLSGGQKQRLALAGVIAMGAGMVLLDEPTANLDPEGAREVIEAVTTMVERTGATLIVVEHQHAAWKGVLDRAIELKDGRIVADGPLDTVVASRSISGLPRAREIGGTSPSNTGAVPETAALWSTDLVTRFGPPRSYALPRGMSTVITGPNGAGKTTWLMTVAGLLPAVSGEIGVAEYVRRGLKGSPLTWKSRELADRIGFVFQNPEHQFVARTVAEELRVAPRVMHREVPEARIAELVESLRLGHLLNANPFTLSGGEKRRLSVATALVTAPEVLLLDEPTFGQDPHTFTELVWLLRRMADEGTTIASVTHDPLFISALGDHRVEVSRG